MKVSIVDLRYKTNEILKALDKNESVEVLYHGKLKGIIQPVNVENKNKVNEHPFFNMKVKAKQSVLEELDQLRAPRHVVWYGHTNAFIKDFNFSILPLTENIGHRALIYVEEYALSASMRAGDAIIAATAIENNMKLSSSNAKHFKVVQELQLKVFKPN